ncbi:MAG: hypothetical protein AVDCRST_MAG11-1217, partial [uncultured Gemmatimonadaceae bacterium]
GLRPPRRHAARRGRAPPRRRAAPRAAPDARGVGRRARAARRPRRPRPG